MLYGSRLRKGFRQCPRHTVRLVTSDALDSGWGLEVFVLGDGQCSFSFGPKGQVQGGLVKDVNTGGGMVVDRLT